MIFTFFRSGTRHTQQNSLQMQLALIIKKDRDYKWHKICENTGFPFTGEYGSVKTRILTYGK